jgi:hypothetical protein
MGARKPTVGLTVPPPDVPGGGLPPADGVEDEPPPPHAESILAAIKARANDFTANRGVFITDLPYKLYKRQMIPSRIILRCPGASLIDKR